MMHDNGDYLFWGMHMLWWFFLLVVFFAILVWFSRFRKRK